jgi:serine/threonine-protein kinase OSR1/STK39
LGLEPQHAELTCGHAGQGSRAVTAEAVLASGALQIAKDSRFLKESLVGSLPPLADRVNRIRNGMAATNKQDNDRNLEKSQVRRAGPREAVQPMTSLVVQVVRAHLLRRRCGCTSTSASTPASRSGQAGVQVRSRALPGPAPRGPPGPQEEYRKGVSSWNFDLAALKAQAAGEPDDDSQHVMLPPIREDEEREDTLSGTSASAAACFVAAQLAGGSEAGGSGYGGFSTGPAQPAAGSNGGAAPGGGAWPSLASAFGECWWGGCAGPSAVGWRRRCAGFSRGRRRVQGFLLGLARHQPAADLVCSRRACSPQPP